MAKRYEHPDRDYDVKIYGIAPGTKRTQHIGNLWADENDVMEELTFLQHSGFTNLSAKVWEPSGPGRLLRFKTRLRGDKWEAYYLEQDLKTIKRAMDAEKAASN